MLLGVILLAAGVLATALASLLLVCIGTAAVGAGAAWTIVAFVTLRQSETPSDLQGRTAAVTQVMTNLPQLVTSVLAATLIGVLPYQVLVSAMGGACLLATAPLLIRRNRNLPTPSAPSGHPSLNG